MSLRNAWFDGNHPFYIFPSQISSETSLSRFFCKSFVWCLSQRVSEAPKKIPFNSWCGSKKIGLNIYNHVYTMFSSLLEVILNNSSCSVYCITIATCLVSSPPHLCCDVTAFLCKLGRRKICSHHSCLRFFFLQFCNANMYKVNME